MLHYTFSSISELTKFNSQWMANLGKRHLSKTMFVLCIILTSACSHTENKTNERVIENEEFVYSPNGNSSEITCPMCYGSGVFEWLPGDIMAPIEACWICHGRGTCDMVTAQRYLGISPQSNGIRECVAHHTSNNACWNCNGRGICTQCAGRGVVLYDGMYGQPGGVMNCSICNGSGLCNICRGRGE